MAGKESRDAIARLIRPEIRALTAYPVPSAAGLIKLDAMENPYDWPGALPEALQREWLDRLRHAQINRYPDPQAQSLKARLRPALGVPEGAELLLGNGSDELIQIIALALARPGATLLAPAPTFVMYEMIATFTGLRYVSVPLRPDFTLDLEAMRAAIAREQPAVVFLAWPNNPTGVLYDREAVRAVIGAAPGLVVVDEAYHAFAQSSFIDEVPRHENLLVMRTLSKQGLAGLRLGVLAGRPEWVAEFDKVRLPYNINTLSQLSAEFALDHVVILDEQAAAIRRERARLAEALRALPGIESWPSAANFILLRVSGGRAGTVHAALRQAGVLIKNLDPAGGLLAGCLRVTVGAPEENEVFLEALRRAL